MSLSVLWVSLFLACLLCKHPLAWPLLGSIHHCDRLHELACPAWLLTRPPSPGERTVLDKHLEHEELWGRGCRTSELQRLHGLRRAQRAPPPNATFCVNSPLGAWVGPWWEYLFHEKWQMLQIGAFFLKSSKVWL